MTAPSSETVLTATETNSFARTYSFVLASRSSVSVSLTGMNRDIDCSVNGSACSNRGGTSDDDWSGQLDAGTHTVSVYPYGGGAGSWTLTVSATALEAPTVRGLPFTVSETGVSGSRTYAFKLPSGSEVNVSLTGMDRDIDCRVNDSNCTNHGGTRDDSWSGALGAGTHVVTVYPYGGSSGSWKLTVTAPGAVEPPPSAPTGVQRTVETRVGLAYSTETNSFGQTYTFTLASRQTVNVSLTGMDRDIDCSVNGLACSNRGGTSDDDWSGALGRGTHTVQVYPYHGGTGAWTIIASVDCPAGYFASGGSCHRHVVPERPIDRDPAPAFGEGPEVLGCDGDTELPADQECVDGFVVFKDSIDVTATPAPLPPPPVQTIVIVIPPPTPTPTPQPPPGPGPQPSPTPEPSGDSLAAATSDINCEGWNIDDGDGFDALRRNSDGTTRKHRAIDIQVSSDDASFFALADGTITNHAYSDECGYQVAVSLPSGGRHVYCHMDRRDRSPAGTEVRAGDRIGSYGPSGVTWGPHLHLKVTDANDRPIDPVEAAGGEDVMAAAGFTFNSSDAEHCAGE